MPSVQYFCVTAMTTIDACASTNSPLTAVLYSSIAISVAWRTERRIICSMTPIHTSTEPVG